MKKLLEVKNLTKEFHSNQSLLDFDKESVKAVNDVSFDIYKGETLGLVGESGCGKTTLGRLILRLIESTSGSVTYDGQNLFGLSKEDLRNIRKKIQIIFQDPYASLNPRMSVKKILSEPMNVQKLYMGSEREKRLKQLLDYVGLSSDSLNKYPHEFSGGQRQRICIARALSLDPEFIVCDEPVSALDVSIQAQVINLLKDLQKELDLTYLFIAHDLKVVEFISDRVAVMYLGKIVETGTAKELGLSCKHPYTKSLFSAIPKVRKGGEDRIILKGDLPSPSNPPDGCHFNPRCFNATDECKKSMPGLDSVSETHQFRCHNPVL